MHAAEIVHRDSRSLQLVKMPPTQEIGIETKYVGLVRISLIDASDRCRMRAPHRQAQDSA